MKNNKVEGWVFTNKNGIWYAATRDNYFALFNGVNKDVICDKSIEELIKKIKELC